MNRMRMFQRILDCFDQCGRLFIVTIGLGSVAILGIIDYSTGFEISFSLFYLIPISFVAWYGGKWPGLVTALISAVTWDLANTLAGQTFSNSAILYWNTATRLGFFTVVILLLSRLRRELERARDISRTDFLTGVANNRAFYDKAAAEILRAERHRHPFTVAYIDLDNFKLINDRYGHSVGNAVLRTVAVSIVDNLRRIDMVARLGGDEFVVLFPEMDADSARLAVGKIHRILLNEMGLHQWSMTFSIGVMTFGTSPRSVDEMIKMADRMMYEVKKSGKNAVRYESDQP